MRTRYTKADRAPTWTFKILAALKEADDFMNLEQIRSATGANMNQATAALWYLKHTAMAVESIESAGSLWWFSTGEDKRHRTVDERVVEPKGNRTRKPRE